MFVHMIVTPLSIVSGSMIDYLQTLKEKWETCKDPEKDAVKMMWGSVNFYLKELLKCNVIMQIH